MGRGGRSASQSWIRRAAAENLGGQKYFCRVVQRASAWLEVSCIRPLGDGDSRRGGNVYCNSLDAVGLGGLLCSGLSDPDTAMSSLRARKGSTNDCKDVQKLTTLGGASDSAFGTLAHVIGILLASDTSPLVRIQHAARFRCLPECVIRDPSTGVLCPSCAYAGCMRQAVFLHCLSAVGEAL